MKLQSEQTQPAQSSREALLDAAERLLAEKGIAGVSVRSIVHEAKANLGAINYHFGTKDRLIAEVLLRRIRPVDQERLIRLDSLEAAVGDGPLRLEEVLDALLRPLVEAKDLTGKQSSVLRLIARAFQEADPGIQSLIRIEFADVARRFNAAILRAVPDLPPNELYWRVMFLVGAVHHGLETWSNADRLVPLPDGIEPVPLDQEQFIQRLIAFIAAGLRASVPSNSQQSKTL